MHVFVCLSGCRVGTCIIIILGTHALRCTCIIIRPNHGLDQIWSTDFQQPSMGDCGGGGGGHRTSSRHAHHRALVWDTSVIPSHKPRCVLPPCLNAVSLVSDNKAGAHIGGCVFLCSSRLSILLHGLLVVLQVFKAPKKGLEGLAVSKLKVVSSVKDFLKGRTSLRDRPGCDLSMNPRLLHSALHAHNFRL